MGVVLWDSCVLEVDIGERTARMGDGGWYSGTAVYKRWILVNRLRGWEMGVVLWDSCVLEVDIGKQTERMEDGGGALGQLCIRGGYW